MSEFAPKAMINKFKGKTVRLINMIKSVFCRHKWSSEKRVYISKSQAFNHKVCKKCGEVKSIAIVPRNL